MPGREEVVQLGEATGMPDIWRPLSLAPSRTANTLAGMLVPISALLFFVIQKSKHKQLFYLLIGGLALLSAVIGLFQILSSAASPLYFYDVTNNGSAVGFFANRNHNAVFLVIGLFAFLHYAWLRDDISLKLSTLDMMVLSAAIIVLVIILVNGSRAGLLSLGIFASCAATIFLLSNRFNRRRKDKNRHNSNAVLRLLFPLVFCLLAVSIITLFFMTDRILALERFFEKSAFEDLRFQAIGVFTKLFQIYWVAGSGFGSFEYVYRIHEPSSLLMSSYVNQAHNDWVQFAIEGGLPAMLIFAVFAIWLVRRLLKLMIGPKSDLRHFVFWLGVFVTIGVASLFDYPLRTPLFQMICVWLVVLFALQSEQVNHRRI
ncbi:MAG: hypothetical protein Pars2KO_22200 [Parasphingorhabdus sp.]